MRLSHYITRHLGCHSLDPATELGHRDVAFLSLGASISLSLVPRLLITSYRHPSPQRLSHHFPRPSEHSFPSCVEPLLSNLLSSAGSLCHPVSDVPCSGHADRPQIPPFLETHPAALSPGEAVKETLVPQEHLLKLMDLLHGICQAVIQARGDLDGDKASIVQTTF